MEKVSEENLQVKNDPAVKLEVMCHKDITDSGHSSPEPNSSGSEMDIANGHSSPLHSSSYASDFDVRDEPPNHLKLPPAISPITHKSVSDYTIGSIIKERGVGNGKPTEPQHHTMTTTIKQEQHSSTDEKSIKCENLTGSLLNRMAGCGGLAQQHQNSRLPNKLHSVSESGNDLTVHNRNHNGLLMTQANLSQHHFGQLSQAMLHRPHPHSTSHLGIYPHYQSSGSKKLENLCLVCGDRASGKHYGVLSCDGCRGFFKRSIRRSMKYVCKENGKCVVDVARRNQCQSCRFRKCLDVKMNKDAVQHERAPRCYQFKGKDEVQDGEAVSVPSRDSHLKVFASHPQQPQPLHQYPGIPAPTHIQAMVDSPRLPMLHFPYRESIDVASAHHHPADVYRNGPVFNPFLLNPPTVALPYQKPEARQWGTFPHGEGGKPLVHVMTPTRDEDKASSLSDHSPSSHSSSSDSSGTTPSRYEGIQKPSIKSNGINKPPSISPLNRSHLATQAPPFLTPPTMGGAITEVETLQETAAKLLFMSVKWARNIPSFLQLPFRDQAILLEESWCELFVLSAAQWSLPVDTATLLSGHSVTRDPNYDDRDLSLASQIKNFKDVVDRLKAYKIDSTEYSCLKAAVLFKSEIRDLRSSSQVETLQDQAQLMLQDYATQHYPDNRARFGRLMLFLALLRTVSARAIEGIFFKKTIGNVPIERLLCDMFKSS